MSFSSPAFLLFFFAVFVVHRAPLPWTFRKGFLLVASWIFYSAANPALVVLLIASTLANWHVAFAIDAAPTPARRRAWTAAAVAFDVGVLAFFKYAKFVAVNAVAAAHALGFEARIPNFEIPLPVGVSFFTFQALSYVIDVHRRELAPCRSPLDFAAYAAFFPHIVAGPIVRASTFLPQLERERRADAAAIDRGAALFVVGMFQKVVLADAILAPVADLAFAPGARPGMFAAWAGSLAFTGQIYCDFAGYTTAAIGAAAALGFTLNENFRRPYGAATFSDFWRRWHISLSTWLRDYLYVPLGGDRRGRARTYANLALVMLVGGLWHGASWTFVAWGALHGLFLVVERAFGARVPPGGLAGAARWGLTFLGVNAAYVFFRAPDFRTGVDVLRGMAGRNGAGGPGPDTASATIAVVVALAIAAAHRIAPDLPPDRALARLRRPAYALALSACLVAFFVLGKPDRAFIYFRF